MTEREGAARRWFLAGFPGSGKSTVGPLVALLAQRVFIDLDEVVGTLEGRDVAEILARDGEAVLREAELRALLRLPPGSLVVALGGGTLDGGAAASWLRLAGDLAWLDVPLDECLRRAGTHGVLRPVLEASVSEGSVEALYRRRRAELTAAGARVDGLGRPQDVADRVLRALGEPLS